MLLAITNHITQNIASIPLLWLAPLTLYLVTFILAFEGRSLYRPAYWWSVVLVWTGGMVWLLVDKEHQFDLWLQLGIYLSGLFVACMFCHGELYRSRPQPRFLTAFYLTISAGGALGGLLVAVVAPLVFNGYFELGVGLVAVALLAAFRFSGLNRTARVASLGGADGSRGCAVHVGSSTSRTSRCPRNFGVMRVKEYGTPGGGDHLRRLPAAIPRRAIPARDAPAYRDNLLQVTLESARRSCAARSAREPGRRDRARHRHALQRGRARHLRFYDINPRSQRREGEFTYLSKAAVEIAIGERG
jgi:hypothetical protein